MPGKWPKTHRLRDLAAQASSLSQRKLSGDKGWPRKRATKQHDLIDAIKRETRKHSHLGSRPAHRYIRQLAYYYAFRVHQASSVWGAYAIGRRALADMAPRLLALAHEIEPQAQTKE